MLHTSAKGPIVANNSGQKCRGPLGATAEVHKESTSAFPYELVLLFPTIIYLSSEESLVLRAVSSRKRIIL